MLVRAALAQESLVALVKRIQPAVVTITVYDAAGKPLGFGSGFFIDQGLLVTNRHVLEGASRAEVRTADGKEYTVTLLVAEDKAGDLVQVQTDIPQDAVHALPLSAALPEVGEHVVVVGSPLGLEQTVSDGLVSAVRDFPGRGKMVQITAPVSPGSSGSPVVNLKGEVIGVATLMGTKGQALNFAVPASRVSALSPQKGRTLAQWTAGVTREQEAMAADLYSTGLRFIKEDGTTTRKDWAKALPYFAEAVQRNPRYAEAWFHVGSCNFMLGHWQDAVEAYQQAIRLKPDYVVAHSGLGVVYSFLGRRQEAIESLKQAIRLQPDFAEAYKNLCFVYYQAGRLQEALEDCKQAIRFQPDSADAHYNLGGAYLMLGDKGSALEEYKILKTLDQDLAGALFNLIYR